MKSFAVPTFLNLKLLLFIAIILFIGLIALNLVTTASPSENTDATMAFIEREVKNYYKSNSNGPLQLSKFSNEKDGWGRQVIISQRGNEYTLTSFGADFHPGGFGPNADIIRSFNVEVE